MKKATLFIISLVFSLAIFAEEEAPKKIDFTKLEIEYISNENILTETELEAYSKISKEFDEKHRTLKREIRKLEKSIKDITSNEEAEKVMYEIVDKKIAQENLEKEYLGMFLKEIPATKLIQVKAACKKFKGELFKNMHKAREKGEKKFSQPMR
jgi:uncharacterized protein YlxW (UPF0749 family)